MNENNQNPNGPAAQPTPPPVDAGAPPPSAVSLPPSAVGHPPSAVSPPPSAVCHPPSAVSQPASAAFSPAKGESDRAFEAFRVYLELGPRRRLHAVGHKVGAAFRTVQRWASDFDWSGRIKSHSAGCADQSARTESTVHSDELLDAAARARAFRERQFVLAEAVLDIAGRYLERIEDQDLEQIRFADACRALEFASRLVGHARETDADTVPDQGLRDQIATLLNQACAETPARAEKT